MGDLSPGANAFLNHGKKSISVNLKTDKGKSILYSLIETASVFIESFTAGVAERLGISYEVLHRINPELVYCSIKGYSDNPEIPGHDINFTAMSGIDITLPVQIADVGSGMYAALEIINHLKNHDYSRITVNMSEIPLLFNAYSLFTENNVLNGEYPSYRIYNVSDGKIALGCLEQKFWTNFTEAIKRPDLKYSRLDISVNRVVEIILSAYKSMEVLKLGRKYNFPVSRVRNRNEIISEMYNGTAPRHGEDTFEILKNNHYSEEEIKNLMENKIIK